jgi:hypothetical protein
MNAFVARFSDRIIPEPNSGCLLWIGASVNGYGCFKERGKSRFAHRCSFIATHGAIPAEQPVIRHRCDTPSCVNPDHLVCGTHADNMRDRSERRRPCKPRARRSGAMITPQVVASIRRESVSGVAVSKLMERFNVARSTVYAIIKGSRWKALSGAVGRAPRTKGMRLTQQSASLIKGMLREGSMTYLEIGNHFGVSTATIGAIAVGRLWKNAA